jgi:hypothetical protein
VYEISISVISSACYEANLPNSRFQYMVKNFVQREYRRSIRTAAYMHRSLLLLTLKVRKLKDTVILFFISIGTKAKRHIKMYRTGQVLEAFVRHKPSVETYQFL